jgi:hypothetical protein
LEKRFWLLTLQLTSVTRLTDKALKYYTVRYKIPNVSLVSAVAFFSTPLAYAKLGLSKILT